MLAGLHHVELCVSNGLKTLKLFTKNFGFRLKWIRETKSCKQWVVGTSKRETQTSFVITERKNNMCLDEDWTTFCCVNYKHIRDSVFNISLEVKDVSRCARRVINNGGKILLEPRIITDHCGNVMYAVVSSCCGNIVHTIINRSEYPTDCFLPGFLPVKETGSNILRTETDGIDHVAYVCQRGQSQKIINWYTEAFGMERFLVNRDEDVDDGMIIGSDIGLRLKAMEYWKCAESGIKCKNYESSEKCVPEDTLKLVIAESIAGQESSHVETFLQEHRCPGVQHIALTTSNIADTVREMISRGVQFRYPPQAYYAQENIEEQMLLSGENISKLQKCGVLIDTEESDINSTNKKYLMQVFTRPLFDEDTFFMEVIQRKGAVGFGSGNILALAKSIEQDHRKSTEIGNLHSNRNQS